MEYTNAFSNTLVKQLLVFDPVHEGQATTYSNGKFKKGAFKNTVTYEIGEPKEPCCVLSSSGQSPVDDCPGRITIRPIPIKRFVECDGVELSRSSYKELYNQVNDFEMGNFLALLETAISIHSHSIYRKAKDIKMALSVLNSRSLAQQIIINSADLKYFESVVPNSLNMFETWYIAPNLNIYISNLVTPGEIYVLPRDIEYFGVMPSIIEKECLKEIGNRIEYTEEIGMLIIGTHLVHKIIIGESDDNSGHKTDKEKILQE